MSFHFLILTFSSSHELSDYAKLHLYDHLCAATTDFLYAHNISDDHPAVEFLHDLENTAYYVAANSGCSPEQYIIQAILRWADMLKYSLKVGASCAVVSLF